MDGSRGRRQADLETTLLNYLKLYDHHIPQRAIGAKTPIQALKEWQQKKPELFVKRVYERAPTFTWPMMVARCARGAASRCLRAASTFVPEIAIPCRR